MHFCVFPNHCMMLYGGKITKSSVCLYFALYPRANASTFDLSHNSIGLQFVYKHCMSSLHWSYLCPVHVEMKLEQGNEISMRG